MRQIFDDLWQTKLEIPFGNLHAHAYFLQREEGNALIYNTGHADEIDHVAALGGINYQYLSHRHEAGDSLRRIRERFGSKLCCHAEEKPAVLPSSEVDITFSGDVTQHLGLEVFHTPGHTSGSVSFLYHSPYGGAYLFTGDTLFRSKRGWETLVISSDGGSTGALLESLESYRALSPDVVLWSASNSGDLTYVEPTEVEWKEIIDGAMDGLRQTRNERRNRL